MCLDHSGGKIVVVSGTARWGDVVMLVLHEANAGQRMATQDENVENWGRAVVNVSVRPGAVRRCVLPIVLGLCLLSDVMLEPRLVMEADRTIVNSVFRLFLL